MEENKKDVEVKEAVDETREDESKKTYTQEEFDNFKKQFEENFDKKFNKKFAQYQEEKEKAILEAKKLADMSAEEKIAAELEDYKAKVAEYERERNLSEMRREARKQLAEKDINLSDELVSMLATEDAETTKKNINNFSKLFKDAVEEEIKNKLKGSTPKRVANPTKVVEEKPKEDLREFAERHRLIK